MVFSQASVFRRIWQRLGRAEKLARRVFWADEILDVDTMPDSLKRDIGLLDGREPRHQPRGR